MRSNGFALLDRLFESPVLTVRRAERQLQVTYPTANKLIHDFNSLGILDEISGRDHNRLFRYGRYLDLFRQDTDVLDTEVETTESAGAISG